MPSSRGSSQPRDQTASLTSPALAGGFFTTSATWEKGLGSPFSVLGTNLLFSRIKIKGERKDTSLLLLLLLLLSCFSYV